MRRQLILLIVALILITTASLFLTLTTGAQDNTPLLATNTPRAAEQPIPTRLLSPPDAAIDRFALRLWLQDDMVALLEREIRLLEAGDSEGALVVRFLQDEMQRRFPGAPDDAFQREVLLEAMLAAPRGLVDMRSVARAFIEDRFNESRPAFDRSSTLVFLDGLNVNIMLADFDSSASRDALIHVRYPVNAQEPAQLLYEDYFPMQIDTDGTYRVMPGAELLPAAPFSPITEIALERLGDINQDGRDEIAVAVRRDDQLNREMFLVGWRSDQFVSLVNDASFPFWNVVEWENTPSFVTNLLRHESVAWNCSSSIPFRWEWQGNLFRSVALRDDYLLEMTIGCQLFSEEPIFSKAPDVAINALRNIIGRPPPEDPAIDRAEMMIAMLMAFDGQTEAARIQAESLQARAQPGSWLDMQSSTFLTALADPDIRPIQICQLLVEASDHGACDVGQALTQILRTQPLRRDLSVESQLEFMGINVVDVTTVSRVGQFDREVAHIHIGGRDYWWAFAPFDADVYTAEPTDPLPGSEPASAPPEFLDVPRVVETFFAEDYMGTLTIIDTAQRSTPDIPLAPQTRFVQALSLDLLGNRSSAREAYYALWADHPRTVWGQVAASHLERR